MYTYSTGTIQRASYVYVCMDLASCLASTVVLCLTDLYSLQPDWLYLHLLKTDSPACAWGEGRGDLNTLQMEESVTHTH